MFGSVKLTKNVDSDKFSNSGYGIGFDTRGEYSLPDSSKCKNVIIFRVYTSSYVNIDNKGKDILILGKGPTRLNQTLTAETQHSVNFTKHVIKFCLSLHYNGSNSFTFVNATQIYQAKAKDSEMKKIFFAFRKYFRRFFS